MRMMAWVGVLAVVLATGSVVAAEREVEEAWFRLLIDDQPSGWVVLRERHAGTDIVSEMQMHMAVKRFGQEIEMDMRWSFTETKDHKPIKARSELAAGAMGAKTAYTFKEDGIHLVASQFGKNSASVIPNPAVPWMTHKQMDNYATGQLAKGVKEFETVHFDTMQFSTLVTTRYRVLGEETIEVGGKAVPATKIEAELSVLPGVKAILYVDRQGRPLRETATVMGIKMVQERTDKALAQSKHTAAELVHQTLIEADKPITNPRQLERAVYTLSVSEGELPTLPDTGVQTFARINDRKGTLVVDLNKATPRGGAKPEVARSIWIDGSDPAIVELRDRVVGGMGRGEAARAEALRAFVHEYVDEKTLDVGFATASEVCKTRQGDCTEHAVLLAALLRADGIPSRVASGLMYVPAFNEQQRVFGYHMWTQAWLDGRWVDLDAVLPAGTAYDATHITVGTSLMKDGQWVNDFIKLEPLTGRLSIEVVKP